MTTRRAFLGWSGVGVLIAKTTPAYGQAQSRIPRIGVLWFAAESDPFPGWSNARFRQRLAELGWVEGKTILIDIRYAERDTRRLRELARDFASGGVDVVVAPAVAASLAARQATSSVPIVMVFAGDPVGAGLITSLARPGGNVTGTSNISVGGKPVQLMREAVPRLAKLAFLVNPTNVGHVGFLTELTAAARSFNIEVVVAEVSRIEDFPNAFSSIRNARADGLFMLVDPLVGGQRSQVIAFAADMRLPVMSDNGETTRAGALMSYGIEFLDHFTMAAEYVDRILKGAKPADLPVQLPRKFEFLINLRSARALGLALPSSLLLRADEVIQ